MATTQGNYLKNHPCMTFHEESSIERCLWSDVFTLHEAELLINFHHKNNDVAFVIIMHPAFLIGGIHSVKCVHIYVFICRLDLHA